VILWKEVIIMEKEYHSSLLLLLFVIYAFLAVSSLFLVAGVMGTRIDTLPSISIVSIGLVSSLLLLCTKERSGKWENFLYSISVMLGVLLLVFFVRFNLSGSQLLYDFGEEKGKRKWAVVVINPFAQRVIEPGIELKDVLESSAFGFDGTLHYSGSARFWNDEELVRFIKPLRQSWKIYRVSGKFSKIVKEVLNRRYITERGFDVLKSRELSEEINDDIESYFRELGFAVGTDIKGRLEMKKTF
jgi:hypothetical protein